jgi:hypothetical protein
MLETPERLVNVSENGHDVAGALVAQSRQLALLVR